MAFSDKLLPRCFVQWSMGFVDNEKRLSNIWLFSYGCWISENPRQVLLVYAKRDCEVKLMQQRCKGFTVHVMWDSV